MMIRAAIYLSIACAGVLGAIVLAVVSVVFALKKQRRRAWVSIAIALVLAVSGVASAFQFVTKSFRAFDTIMTDNSYYADQLGADCQYQLSFKCEKAVIDQIIAALGLVEVPGSYSDPGLRPRTDFTWWKPESTSGRTLWAKEKKDEYHWRLWYAEEDGVAFYQEYSLFRPSSV